MINSISGLTIHKTLNYFLVLFAFIFPLSSKKATVVLVVMIVLWIAEGRWKEKFQTLLSVKPLIYYGMFILFLGLSLCWSDTLYGGFVKHYPANTVVAYFRMYVFGFLLIPIMLTSMDKNTMKWFVSAFLTAMFISEVTSWLVYLDMIHLKNVLPTDPSPFMHHSLYSVFLAVTIFLLLTEFKKLSNRSLKMLMAFFIVSALVNLFLNGGRLGQLAFFLALSVFILMHFKWSVKSFVWSILSVSVVFVLAYQVSPIFHKRVDNAVESLYQIQQGNYQSSWGQRAFAWSVAKDIIIENPLFGVGMGEAKKVFREKLEQTENGKLVKGFWHMHNQYIQTLMDGGIIALFLLGAFFYQLVKLKLPEDMHILLCTMITIYLAGFIGEPLFWNLQPFLLFNAMIAVFLLQAVWLSQNRQGVQS